MSSINPVRKAYAIQRKYSELVVPAATAASGFEWGPLVANTGPYTVAEFIDGYILSDFNICQAPAGALQRQSSWTGGRAVYVALTSESIISSAPTAVQALAASLVSASKESFAIDAKSNGDCWIIAKRTEGLRHGCYQFLKLLGVIYPGPHPSWTVRPKTGSVIAQSVSRVFSPVIPFYYPAANGGLGNHGVTFPGYVATTVTGFIKNFMDSYVKQRYPRETNFYASDGGSGVIYYRQHEYRQGDKSMLAWNPTGPSTGIRGQSSTSGGAQFPDMCFSQGAPVLSKFCPTHHGTTGTGSYPAPLAAGTPWVGVRITGPTCTVGVNDPPGSPATQTGINPSAGDYTSFAGGVQMFCEQTLQAALQQIDLSGDLLAFNNSAVGVSPNDGAYECRCDMCWGTTVGAIAPRERSGGLCERKYGLNVDTTDSDLVAEMGNLAQAYIKYMLQHVNVQVDAAWSAYADHSAPPSIPLVPGQWIAILPQTAGTTNITAGEVISGWVAKSASNPGGPVKIGMQYTWVIASNYDVPNLNPRDAGAQAKKVIGQGIRAGIFNQTTNSNLAAGCLNFVLSELSWDVSADIEVLIGQYFLPLGAAATAIRSMYERWWDWFELAGHEIGQMCLDLQAAQTALTADSTHTAAQQDALDHEKCAVHWLRVLYDWQNALRAYQLLANSTTLANLLAAADAAIGWAWNIVPTAMINSDLHATNIYNLLPASGTGVATLRAKWLSTDAGAAGFATVALPSTSALTAIIAADLVDYPRITGVTRKSFGFQVYPVRAAVEPLYQGTQLVPFNQTGASGAVLVNTIRLSVTYQTFRFRKGAGDITFHLQQAQLAAGITTLPTRIRVLDDNANVLMLFQATASNPSAFIDHSFTITGIPAGDYTLEFNDAQPCNGNQYLQWPQNVTLCQLNLFHTSPFQQTVRVYFYVPASETKIVMSALLTTAPNFYDPSGTLVTPTQPYPRNFVADCTGKAGQWWSFDNSQGINSNNYIRFENCPNVFAFDPLQGMVPAGLDGHF
jgi:hypothetical protein